MAPFNQFQGLLEFFISAFKILYAEGKEVRRRVLPRVLELMGQFAQFASVAPVMFQHIFQQDRCRGALTSTGIHIILFMMMLVTMTMDVIVMMLVFRHG